MTAPYALGPMPTDRRMTTIDERLVAAPLAVIFALAADVEDVVERQQQRVGDGGGGTEAQPLLVRAERGRGVERGDAAAIDHLAAHCELFRGGLAFRAASVVIAGGDAVRDTRVHYR